MLTVFAIPKAFEGHIGRIQRNSLYSWKALGNEVEIILMGDEAGTAEAADAAGVRHIPDIKINESGTPLVNEVFHKAVQCARGKVLCYVNADIILTRSVLRLIATVGRTGNNYLASGRRVDADLLEELDPGSDWEAVARELVLERGTRQKASWMDYFIFPRSWYPSDMPPFAVGRPHWDRWMIFAAKRSGVSVIDATRVVLAVHQNHDYSHIKSGYGNKWKGPEGDFNRVLAKGMDKRYTIKDADYFASRRNRLLPTLLAWEYLEMRMPRFVRKSLGWCGYSG